MCFMFITTYKLVYSSSILIPESFAAIIIVVCMAYHNIMERRENYYNFKSSTQARGKLMTCTNVH